MSKIILTAVDPSQTSSPPAGYVTIILGNDGILYTLDSAGALTPVGTGVVGTNTLYTHNQNVASATWLITHNLNTFPNIVVIDSAGTRVFGDEQYINSNTVLLTFSAPFGGKAYLTFNPQP